MVNANNKKIYFELMRIIAVALVIFNHLAGYTLYQISSGVKQWLYMILTMVTRINVPFFFMISGALLLRKDEDYAIVVKKRLSRFVLILILFEGAYFLCYKVIYRVGRDVFNLNRFIHGVFAGDLDGLGSYWYLYAYIGMLLTLPFMQRIAKGIRKEDFWLLMFLHFCVFSFIPLINILLIKAQIVGISLSGSFSIPFVTGKQFFYPILGYYLEEYVDVRKIKRKHFVYLISAAFVGICISCLCTVWEGETTGIYTQNYVELFDYLITVVAFIIIKYFVVIGMPKVNDGKSKIGGGICFISSLTFGIYLLDPLLKMLLYSKYNQAAELIFPTLIVSIGWVLISMVLGGTLTFVLKQIPGIKALI